MSETMTPERAIKKRTELIEYMKYCLAIDSDCCLLDEDKRMIISALELQIPKKPLIKTHTYSGSDDDFTNKYYCPVCNKLIVCEDTNGYYAGKIVEHCPCGQALDWSDEE